MSPSPLRGFRVLDLTNVLAGPFCCHQLAHLGAEVVKVEAPGGGDLARQLGADPALNARGMGASFLAQNAGKRSIALNLKTPGGQAVLRRLVQRAHVLVENFRPGVMARLGLGYDALLADNPRLVYCAISGFGQQGPLRGLPAYDQIIQGMSGAMAITGGEGTAPLRAGWPAADTVGGLTAAMAIAAALADRQRQGGLFIDVSMLEAMMSTLGWAVSNTLVAGQEPRPLGNDNATASPSGTFRTRDGLLNIAANQQAQFEALCQVLGHTEWVADPRFAQRQARLQHRAALSTLIEAALQADTAQAWWPRLGAAGVPCGPVLGLAQALEQPQLAQRDFVGSFPAKDFPQASGMDRPVRQLRTGFLLNGHRPAVASPPPTVDQHGAELLAELGYAPEEIHALQQEQHA